MEYKTSVFGLVRLGKSKNWLRGLDLNLGNQIGDISFVFHTTTAMCWKWVLQVYLNLEEFT
jgi:hypothetical protein